MNGLNILEAVRELDRQIARLTGSDRLVAESWRKARLETLRVKAPRLFDEYEQVSMF